MVTSTTSMCVVCRRKWKRLQMLRQAQAPDHQGARDSTLRLGVSARDHLRTNQAEQSIPLQAKGEAPRLQGARDSTLRLGVPARDHLRTSQAEQPFPVRPRRGGARDDAVEPFGRRGAGCVCAHRHRACSAAEKTPEAVNNVLGDLVD